MPNPNKYKNLETMGIPNNYKQITPRTPRFGNGGVIPKQPAIKAPPKLQIAPRGTPIPKTRYTPLPQSAQEAPVTIQEPVSPPVQDTVAQTPVAPTPVEPVAQAPVTPTVAEPMQPPVQGQPVPVQEPAQINPPQFNYNFRPQPIIPHGNLPQGMYAPFPERRSMPRNLRRLPGMVAPTLQWLARNFIRRNPRFNPRYRRW